MLPYLIVGTANGSKESNSSKSMGTEMRPGDNTKKSQIQLFMSWGNVLRLVITCFGVNTEGALQQVVDPLTDIHVKSWVTILQHDFLLKMLALFCSALQEKWVTSSVQMPGMFMKVIKEVKMMTSWIPTCFLMAWFWICVQRFSGFLSFWKFCCNSFLTCKHEVKVHSKALHLIKWTINLFSQPHQSSPLIV